jgi:hypothetical protein
VEWPGRRAVEPASECSGVGSRQVDVSSPWYTNYSFQSTVSPTEHLYKTPEVSYL